MFIVHEAMGAFDENTAISEVQNVALQLVHHCCELSVRKIHGNHAEDVETCFFFVLFFFTNLWLFKMSGQQNE